MFTLAKSCSRQNADICAKISAAMYAKIKNINNQNCHMNMKQVREISNSGNFISCL